VVRLLIQSGARTSAANRYGITPLSLAAANGSIRLTRALLEAGADPNATTPEGETILMTAARTGSPEVIERLIAAGARVNDVEGWRGETALMWAAAENNAAAVRAFAARGAAIDARSKTIEYPDIKLNLAFMATAELPRGGFTALMFAGRQGARDAARALVAAGANADLQDPEGMTAMTLAIINTHYDVALDLVQGSGNPNVVDRAGMGALYAVIDMRTLAPMTNMPPRRPTGDVDSLELIRALLERGADANAALKGPTLRRHYGGGDGSLGEGTTPLMRAAKFGDTEAMRSLLEKGADPNRRQRNGTTALMIASGAGLRSGDGGFARTDRVNAADLLEAVELCLSHGADVNAATTNGETALHAAAARGSDDVVIALAQKGAQLDAKDKSGRTPLDAALGKPAGGRGGGEPGPAHETTAALLRRLMAAR
jgi:ankyrin repeat protein